MLSPYFSGFADLRVSRAVGTDLFVDVIDFLSAVKMPCNYNNIIITY